MVAPSCGHFGGDLNMSAVFTIICKLETRTERSCWRHFSSDGASFFIENIILEALNSKNNNYTAKMHDLTE